jgi:glutamine synthetase type III
VPVNTNVTLTATTNTDVGPTIWYIDIVDQSGAIVRSCPSGSSCTATVSSASAASRTYTAWLSTSPSSLAGGGPRSNSVTVSWA